MNLIDLSSRDRSALRRMLREAKEVDHYQRVLAILELDRGRSATQVAETLGVTRQSVYNWAKLWSAEGDPLGLKSQWGEGRPTCWTDEMLSLLEQAMKRRPEEFGFVAMNWTVGLLQEYLYLQCGRKLSDDTIRRRLALWGYVWKRYRYTLPVDPEREKKTGDSTDSTVVAAGFGDARDG